jgi:hypothetical protein
MNRWDWRIIWGIQEGAFTSETKVKTKKGKKPKKMKE